MGALKVVLTIVMAILLVTALATPFFYYDVGGIRTTIVEMFRKIKKEDKTRTTDIEKPLM